MELSTDQFAQGMVATNESDYGNTSKLDEYQYGLFSAELPKNSKILEIGAGTGRISRLLMERHPVSEFVISEPSAYFMGLLQERFSSPVVEGKVRLIQGETNSLVNEFPGYFDAIFSVHVMEHVEDDVRFIDECLKMLKPGGTLIVLVPALQFLYSNLDKSIGHFRRYDKKMVRQLVSPYPIDIKKLFYSNLFGVLPSLFFLKFGKLEYSSSSAKKAKFTGLSRIYSRYFIPLVEKLEKFLPVPVGLNLTLIATKKGL